MASNRTKRKRRRYEALSFDTLRDKREQLWQQSDNKSINASLDWLNRKKLRQYARDEVYNNSYAYGAGQALVTNIIGTGPRLQVVDRLGTDRTDNIASAIEEDFKAWTKEIRFARKLRAMRFSKFVDGEAFAIMHGNQKLDSDVKLDFTPIDCDRVTSHTNLEVKDRHRDIDGITTDEWGNPVSYRVLNEHPGGDAYGLTGSQDAKDYPAHLVCHWFNMTSSEMGRGLPEIAPALKTFAFLRRYTYAVVRASECAADIAMCLYTDTDDEGEDFEDEVPLENPILEHSFSRGSAISIPYGMKVEQVKPEQPSSNYDMMVRQLLSSAGASIGLPAMIILNSARDQSYSGGRIELQEFYRYVQVEQQSCVEAVLEPIFKEWVTEWLLVNGYQSSELRNLYCRWQFDGFEHVDPLKEARAQVYRVTNNLTTLADEYGRIGKDWIEELKQRAVEQEYIKKLEEQYDVRLNLDEDFNQGVITETKKEVDEDA